MSAVGELAQRRDRAGSASPSTAVSVVLVGAFMATLDSFIVIVAGPAIRADLGASGAEVQWILAGYQLSYAVFLVTGGRLGDLFGRKRLFVGGLALFTLASVACAAAPTATALIVARLVQGLGAALMLPQVYATIVVVLSERDQPRAFGRLGVALGLATILGQVLGGLLIGADLFGSGWRPVFWINVPVGLVCGLLALRHLPESRATQNQKLDLPGVATLSVALTLLAYPLIQGRELGWPWWSWACLAASAAAFALFVVLERLTEARGAQPLVRIGLFGSRSFSVGLALVVAVYAVITSYYLVLSISLQQGLGLSALDAGLVYVPAAVTFLTFSLVAGRLVPRYGRRVLEAGAALLAAGYASTVIVLPSGVRFTPGVVIPTLMLQSLGGGLLITPSLNVVLSRITPTDVGTASGALSTAQQIGAALGVAAIGVVFYASGAPTAPRPAAHALAMASIFTMATAILAGVLVSLLPPHTTAGDHR
jgi:EmrB/QacA subfamily drug resistance transporter